MGIRIATDATFATPYNQNPVSMGADLVLHSGTKYISGHSDLLIGLAGFNRYYDEFAFSRKHLVAHPTHFRPILLIVGLKRLA